MRRLFSILFAFGAIVCSLSSCEKESLITSIDDIDFSNKLISINTSMYKAHDTKTVSNSDCTNGDNKLTSLSLKAYYSGVAIIGSDSSFETYTKGSDSKYTTSDKYFWPTDATTTAVNFYAIAENNQAVAQFEKATTTTVNKSGIAITDYTVETDSNEITSNPSGSAVAQNDPCVAILSAKSTESVNLEFNHILSRVQIRAKAEIATTTYKLEAKFLAYEFRNVITKGSASAFTSISNISWTSSATGSVRDNRFSVGNTFSTANNGVDITNINDYVALDDSSWCNVIPGMIDQTNLQIVLKVAFYDSSTHNLVSTRYLTAKPTYESGVTKFEPGKKYQFDITIKDAAGDDTDGTGPDSKLNEILISNVTVTDWETVTAAKHTFQ